MSDHLQWRPTGSDLGWVVIYNRVLLRNWNKEPKSDFSGLGGPGDPSDTATGSGVSLWSLVTFLDVVAIDSARHGLERGFFRSKMSGGSEDSFFVH